MDNISKKSLWVGRIISALVTLFMGFDIVIHALKIQPVVDAFNQLGLPLTIAVPISIIALACIILYNIPKTSILGAILLTGYLGGAILTNYRVGKPLFSTILFPVYVGLFAWLGLWLRDTKVKNIIPFNK